MKDLNAMDIKLSIFFAVAVSFVGLAAAKCDPPHLPSEEDLSTNMDMGGVCCCPTDDLRYFDTATGEFIVTDRADGTAGYIPWKKEGQSQDQWEIEASNEFCLVLYGCWAETFQVWDTTGVPAKTNLHSHCDPQYCPGVCERAITKHTMCPRFSCSDPGVVCGMQTLNGPGSSKAHSPAGGASETGDWPRRIRWGEKKETYGDGIPSESSSDEAGKAVKAKGNAAFIQRQKYKKKLDAILLANPSAKPTKSEIEKAMYDDDHPKVDEEVLAKKAAIKSAILALQPGISQEDKVVSGITVPPAVPTDERFDEFIDNLAHTTNKPAAFDDFLARHKAYFDRDGSSRFLPTPKQYGRAMDVVFGYEQPKFAEQIASKMTVLASTHVLEALKNCAKSQRLPLLSAVGKYIVDLDDNSNMLIESFSEDQDREQAAKILGALPKTPCDKKTVT